MENIKQWNAADTSTYLLLRILFSDAQHYMMAYGIAIGTGLGKTFTAEEYTKENEDVFYLNGREDMNRKALLVSLADKLKISSNESVPVLLKRIVEKMGEMKEPLLIIDNAHNLKDRVL